MTTTVGHDTFAAASHLNMIEHVSGPMAAGAQETELPIGPTAEIDVDWNAREPLVIAAPRRPLEATALRLRPVLDPGGAATPLPPLDFGRFSEAGAFLALYRPPVAESTATAAPFRIGLSLAVADLEGNETPVADAEVQEAVEVRIIEGVLGRLIFALGAEKARIRREASEISSLRLLEHTRLDALDRLGEDLGVPRFDDHLAFRDGAIVTDPRVEPDDEYRRRLSIYKPWLTPTRRHVLELLNGPGGGNDPNTGALGELGQPLRLRLLEDDNEFAVAIHLVSVGNDQQRLSFIEHIRRSRLVLPRNDPPDNQIHASRFLASTTRDRVQELRAGLRAGYQLQPGTAFAPLLAIALERVRRCRAALGVNTPWNVLRSLDPAGGSRYELGLGADLEIPPAAELDVMAAEFGNPARVLADPETESLLAMMTPRPTADDPEARWLLHPCGLNTVHRLNADRLYVSHFSTFGLAITAPSNAPAGGALDLEARYHAPGDPGKNVVLLAGLVAALDAWQSEGRPPWALLPDTDAVSQWGQATSRPSSDPALAVFRAAILPAITEPDPVVQRLGALPSELIETLRLAPAQASAILAGDSSAAESLRRLVEMLRAEGLASALPLITASDEVLLVVSVIGLPEAGINVSEKRSSGFRWHAVSIQGEGGRLGSAGSRTSFTPSGPGLYAVVCLGYARRGLTDPYEYRVELPTAGLLDLLQYEYLMNLLDHTYPLGVEVNTYAIRKQHVDLDGDGIADPLMPAVSRTYRAFQRSRYRG